MVAPFGAMVKAYSTLRERFPPPGPAATLPDTSTKQDNSSGSPGRPPSTVFVNAFRHFAKFGGKVGPRASSGTHRSSR
ncbi:MAG: hypothetical protein DIU77_018455, partial [Thermocrispum agreste]